MRTVIGLLCVALAVLGLVGCGSEAPHAARSTRAVLLTGSPATPSTGGAVAPSSGSAVALPATPSLRPAARLAAQITQAESTIASPASTAAGIQQAGEFEQLADRLLSESSARPRQRVLALLHGRARAITAANVAAADGLKVITAPQPHLPTWRIVAPLPAKRLMRLYRAAQRRTGVPWTYLAAINFVETKFGRIVGPSYAGAQGPMQFMPATWATYGEGGDIHDARDAIPAAARFLRDHGAPGNMARALRAYNNAASYVNAVTSYAGVMRRWPRAFQGYRSWRVLYRARSGVWALPVGYPATKATLIAAR